MFFPELTGKLFFVYYFTKKFFEFKVIFRILMQGDAMCSTLKSHQVPVVHQERLLWVMFV